MRGIDRPDTRSTTNFPRAIRIQMRMQENELGQVQVLTYSTKSMVSATKRNAELCGDDGVKSCNRAH